MGGLRDTRYQGVDRTGLAGYNLVRMANPHTQVGDRGRVVRVTSGRLCAPFRGSQGVAGPTKPAWEGPDKAFQDPSDHRSTDSAARVGADVTPNLFFSSLLPLAQRPGPFGSYWGTERWKFRLTAIRSGVGGD